MGKRAFVVTALAVAACATGSVVVTDDGGGGQDATSSDVVTADVQKNDAGCVPPQIKCSGDAQSCIDITQDPNNCGQCGTVCAGPDAGPEGGNGNPDAGIPIPDSGLDTGTGWAFPSGSCTSSKCALGCGDAGAQLCTDNLCWDMQNSHEHCGNCSTACAADVEWCTHGHCCSTGTDYCNAQCVSTNTDPNNCGKCGNVCPNTAPACVNGACSQQVSVTTVCNLSNPSGILCSGNCSTNHAAYADAYCKLAGYTKAVSYTVLTSGSVQCIYYNTQNTVPTMCSQILGPTTYGLATTCDAIQALKCQ